MIPNPLTTNACWPQTLIDVLERQQALVDQLDHRARQQVQFIQSGATNQLLELLGRRQNVIDEFTASQNQLAGLTQGLEQHLESTSQLQRDRIKALIAEIGERL